MIESTMKSDELPNWFVDLLILRATDRLDKDQQQQFNEFVENHPDRDQINATAQQYEFAAAAIDLNYQRDDSESASAFPSDLREKLRHGARQHFRSGKESTAAVSLPPTTDSAQQRVAMTSREALAWMAAAAAVILLMTGLNPFAGPSPSKQGPETATLPPSIEQRFEEFNNALIEDRVTVPWTATAADSQASGSVVWSDSRQQGFMTFEGFAANDPARSQYQLWIFDTDASQSHPVDGGVFNIAGDGGDIVSIDARIPVSNAVMFAITEERPGGVVVSDRKHLPLLAKVE